MPKGHPILIEFNDLPPMSLNELADMHGLARRTVHGRYERGARTIEQLTRPADMRQSRPGRKRSSTVCLNSLLAGWSLAPGVSEATMASGPSARFL